MLMHALALSLITQVRWLVGALESGGQQDVFASRARGRAGTLGTASGADLALLMQGPAADEAITIGRTVAGR